MFLFKSAELERENTDLRSRLATQGSTLDALESAMAVIEFDSTGNIQFANRNFLTVTGYDLAEIKGKHHEVFCFPEYARTPEYRKFWASLSTGKPESGLFERLDKKGGVLWLEATYNPVRDSSGKVVKVIKFAADVTGRVLAEQANKAKVDALSRSTAIIEFEPNGVIVDCNDNFLRTVGYTKDQLVGNHHRMFCESEYAASEAYVEFWEQLNNGQFASGQFKRIDSSGKVLWLEASYNPVYDMKGRLFRVIKFASNITEQTEQSQKTEESAGLARKISGETFTIAEQGGEVIRNAAREMTQIADSVKASSEHIESLNSQSTQINSIISTIQEIADQTNLLALNAAIEAARAGDQGRGFAVVADEVRQLAARTSQSTSEISSMIHSIQEDTSSASDSMVKTLEQAERGVELANETGEVISKIQTASSEVVRAMDSYSSSVG